MEEEYQSLIANNTWELTGSIAQKDARLLDQNGPSTISILIQLLLMEVEKRGKKIPDDSERIELIKNEHARGHFSVESMFRRLWK